MGPSPFGDTHVRRGASDLGQPPRRRPTLARAARSCPTTTEAIAEAASLATPEASSTSGPFTTPVLQATFLGRQPAQPAPASPGLQSRHERRLPPATTTRRTSGSAVPRPRAHDFQAFNFSSNPPRRRSWLRQRRRQPGLSAACDVQPQHSTCCGAEHGRQRVRLLAGVRLHGHGRPRMGAVGSKKNWKFTRPTARTAPRIIAVCTMAPPERLQRHRAQTARPAARSPATDGGGTVVGTYDNIP